MNTAYNMNRRTGGTGSNGSKVWAAEQQIRVTGTPQRALWTQLVTIRTDTFRNAATYNAPPKHALA